MVATWAGLGGGIDGDWGHDHAINEVDSLAGSSGLSTICEVPKAIPRFPKEAIQKLDAEWRAENPGRRGVGDDDDDDGSVLTYVADYASPQISEREISHRDIQDAKKHGSVSLEFPICDGKERVSMDQAQRWSERIQRHFEERVELGLPSNVSNATPPRVELCLIRSDTEAQEIRRFLVEAGFFAEGHSDSKICYHYPTIGANLKLKVVEGWDAESERSRVVAIMFERKRKDTEEFETGQMSSEETKRLAEEKEGWRKQILTATMDGPDLSSSYGTSGGREETKTLGKSSLSSLLTEQSPPWNSGSNVKRHGIVLWLKEQGKWYFLAQVTIFPPSVMAA